MAKFVVVNEDYLNGTEQEKGTVVIKQPDFLEQIEANARKAPKNNQTAVNHLREVLSSIAEKYDQEMNVYKINLTNYIGLPFKTNQDLSAIFTRILKDQYPAIFGKYLEATIKARPMNTKLIYYVGNLNSATPFYQAGLDLLDQKDVQDYLSGKPKKVVGKPAITNEEASKNATE